MHRNGKGVKKTRRWAAAKAAIFLVFAAAATATNAASEKRRVMLAVQDKPELVIPIPDVHFSDFIVRDAEGSERYLDIPWLGEYVTGVYSYAVVIAGLLAGVMFLVGGFQYLTAGGDAGRVTKAKERIKDAIIGLFLTLGAFVILTTISPQLTSFDALSVKTVKRISFSVAGSVGEGEGAETYVEGVHDTVAASEGSTGGGTPPAARTDTSTGGTAGGHGAAACAHYTSEIASGNIGCQAPGGPFPSPTGQPYACNYHTEGGRAALDDIRSLDVRGNYQDTYYAPVAGTIHYRFPTGWADCSGRGSIGCLGGGTIVITFGEGYRFGIAHALPIEGAPPEGSTVSVGQAIGRVGGKCCATYAPGTPAGDLAQEKTTGWKPSRPDHSWSASSCRHAEPCDPPWLVGNSTGPHAHIRIGGPGGALPILACFKQS